VKSTILPTKSSHSGNLQSYLEIETKAPLLEYGVVQISWVVPAYFNGIKKYHDQPNLGRAYFLDISI
jgi:hypothetical protein